MTCTGETTAKGFHIPRSAITVANYTVGERLNYHVMPNTIIVTKGRMTAMEIVDTAVALKALHDELIQYLADVCHIACCPCSFLDEFERENVQLPNYIREEAGFDEGVKLCAEVNDDGTVTVSEADYLYDLSDVPKDTLRALAEAGCCPDFLDEVLMSEEIIYDE